MFWGQAWRYDSYHANAYDLSYVDQPIWATTKISFLYSSLAVNNTYLGEHFSPILGLISLPYSLFNSTYFLFFLQCLVLSLPVFLLYKISIKLGNNASTSALIAICYLMYQPLRTSGFFDFREDNLFPILFFGFLLSFLNKKTIFGYFLFIALLTVKENAALFTLAAGFLICFKPFNEASKKHGIIISILSIFAFIIINQKVTPYFSGTASKTRFSFRLGAFGNSTGDFLSYIILHPILFSSYLLKSFLTKSVFKYFLILFTPFVFFIKKMPIPFAIAFAGFSLNVILGINSIGFHYECIFLPFLFFGLANSLKNISWNSSKYILLIVSFLLFFGRSPLFHIRQWLPSEHHKDLTIQLKQIPEHASVSTQTAIHPHLSHRKSALLLNGRPETDYVVIDLDESIDRYGTPNLLNDLAQIKEENYELLTDEDTKILIFKKIN